VEVEPGASVVDEGFLWAGTAGRESLRSSGDEGAVEGRRRRVREVDCPSREVERIRYATDCPIASRVAAAAADHQVGVDSEQAEGVGSGVRVEASQEREFMGCSSAGVGRHAQSCSGDV
jgi:hypothetical protein